MDRLDRRSMIFVLLLVALANATSPAAAQPELFAHRPEVDVLDRPPHFLLRRAYVDVLRETLPTIEGESKEIELNLFPGTSLKVVLTCELIKNRVRSWKGSVIGAPYSTVSFYQSVDPFRLGTTFIETPTPADYPYVGRIRFDQALYIVRPVNSVPGLHAVEEVDVDSLPTENDDIAPFSPPDR